MLAPARRASCQCFFVTSELPAKKTKSILWNEEASIRWMNAGSSPAVVTWPTTSSSSRRTKSEAASGDSPSSSLSSLPTSDDAPTIPIRYILFAMYPATLLSLHPRHRIFTTAADDSALTRTGMVTALPAPRVRQPCDDPGDQIPQCNDDQHVLRIERYQSPHHGQHRTQLEWMATAQADLLAAP